MTTPTSLAGAAACAATCATFRSCGAAARPNLPVPRARHAHIRGRRALGEARQLHSPGRGPRGGEEAAAHKAAASAGRVPHPLHPPRQAASSAPATAGAAAATVAGGGITASTSSAGAAPATAPAAPPASQPAAAPTLDLVRFPCNQCGKRLKARVPLGTRKIKTDCTACKASIEVAISVGGAGSAAQQSGRARHGGRRRCTRPARPSRRLRLGASTPCRPGACAATSGSCSCATRCRRSALIDEQSARLGRGAAAQMLPAQRGEQGKKHNYEQMRRKREAGVRGSTQVTQRSTKTAVIATR